METVVGSVLVALITSGPLYLAHRRSVGPKNGSTVHEKLDAIKDWQYAHTQLDEIRHKTVVERLETLENA